MTILLCEEPCAVVRQSVKSVAYDKIDPKELFRRLKRGFYKGEHM